MHDIVRVKNLATSPEHIALIHNRGLSVACPAPNSRSRTKPIFTHLFVDIVRVKTLASFQRAHRSDVVIHYGGLTVVFPASKSRPRTKGQYYIHLFVDIVRAKTSATSPEDTVLMRSFIMEVSPYSASPANNTGFTTLTVGLEQNPNIHSPVC